MNNSTTDVSLEPLPLWSVVLFDVIMGVIMFVGVAGNALILLVEAFNKQMTSTDWLVATLSAIDILIAGFTIPVDMLFFSGVWSQVGSDALCRIHSYIRDSFGYCITLLLSVTAIDRYIKTCRPHSRGVTPNRSKWACFSIVLATSIMNAPILFSSNYDELKQCKHSGPALFWSYVSALVVFIQISFFIMFGIVIVCYAKIAYVIRHKLKRTGVTLDEPSKSRVGVGPPQSSNMTASGANITKETFVCEPKSVVSDIARVVQRGAHESSTSFADGHLSVGVTSFNPLTNNSNEREDQSGTALDKGPGSQTGKRNKCTKTERQRPKQELPVMTQAMLQQKKVNRTTLIMFAVTLVFLLAWIPPWIAWGMTVMGDNSVMDRVIIMFARRAFVINTVTNPLFYISMSTAFRSMTKTVFRNIADKLRIRA